MRRGPVVCLKVAEHEAKRYFLLLIFVPLAFLFFSSFPLCATLMLYPLFSSLLAVPFSSPHCLSYWLKKWPYIVSSHEFLLLIVSFVICSNEIFFYVFFYTFYLIKKRGEKAVELLLGGMEGARL